MIRKKRGQVTIFMIVALVILLLGAFFFFFQRADLTKLKPVSPEVAPVKNFIETCINDIAKQAINILGTNGGYITFPDHIETNKNSYLQLGPISNIKNPYWWYDGIESIPPESFMIKQIEDYVSLELKTCIQDFAAFSNQFDVREKGNLDVKITLNEDDVTVDVNYPLELTNKLDSKTLRLEKFKETIPVRLKKVYETARDIMEAENKDFFLEFKTIDLISLDGDIPTTDYEVTCQEKIWVAEQVEQKLKRLLNVNLPYINVVNSVFNDEIYVPNPFGKDTYKDSYFENHYKWQISDKNYDDLRISIDYEENWPFRFYVRPSKDGLLRSNPQKGLDLVDFLCLHIWHFTYDVVFPVRVTITDEHGLEPYQFRFAFKVSVDHNQPRRENFAATVFESPDIGNEEFYCNDLVNEVTILTLSNSTNEFDIADVNLSYSCGIYTCNIGKTDWISFGAAAGLTARFPFCSNGILRGNKDGFEEGLKFIQTETPGTYNLFMRPLKEIDDYEIVKHDFDNPSKTFRLGADERASISIKSTKDDFESVGIYPKEGSFPIKLLNDNHQYDVTIYLSDDKGIIGGYKGIWNVNVDEISTAKKIKFHVLEKKGSQDEILLFIAGLNSYSQNIPKPEII